MRQSHSTDKANFLWENAGGQKRLTIIHESSQLRATSKLASGQALCGGQGTVVPTDSVWLILTQGAVCFLVHHLAHQSKFCICIMASVYIPELA